jgi:hypothetical protein
MHREICSGLLGSDAAEKEARAREILDATLQACEEAHGREWLLQALRDLIRVKLSAVR